MKMMRKLKRRKRVDPLDNVNIGVNQCTIWTVMGNDALPKFHSVPKESLQACSVDLYSTREESWRRTNPPLRSVLLKSIREEKCRRRPFLPELCEIQNSAINALKYYTEDYSSSVTEMQRLAIKYLMRVFLNVSAPQEIDSEGYSKYHVTGRTEPLEVNYSSVMENSKFLRAVSWIKKFHLTVWPGPEACRSEPGQVQRVSGSAIRELGMDKKTPCHIIVNIVLRPKPRRPDLKNRKSLPLEIDDSMSTVEREQKIRETVEKDYRSAAFVTECGQLIVQLTKASFLCYSRYLKILSSDYSGPCEFEDFRDEVRSYLEDFNEHAVKAFNDRQPVEQCMIDYQESITSLVKTQFEMLVTHLKEDVIKRKMYQKFLSYTLCRIVTGLRLALTRTMLSVYCPGNGEYYSKLIQEYLLQRLKFAHVLTTKCLYKNFVTRDIIEQLSTGVYSNLFLRDSAQFADSMLLLLELLYGDVSQMKPQSVIVPHDEECRYILRIVKKLDHGITEPNVTSEEVTREFELRNFRLAMDIKSDMASFLELSRDYLYKTGICSFESSRWKAVRKNPENIKLKNQ